VSCLYHICITDNVIALPQVEERLRASQVGRRGRPTEVLKLHINTHESVGSSSSDGQGFCDGSVQAGLTLKGFKKGDALLIWNMLTDGATPDASAAHLFCTGGEQVRLRHVHWANVAGQAACSGPLCR
jgi:hypothetical protein